MKLFAFDRDFTVDCAEDPGPVPLDWIKRLDQNHEVWAIGNQRLKEEAGIPGVEELKSLLGKDMPEKPADWRALSNRERNYAGKAWRLSALEVAFPGLAVKVFVDDYAAEVMERFSNRLSCDWFFTLPVDFVGVGFDQWAND